MLHRYTRNLPMHLVRALAPPRLAVGALVTLTLLSAACSSDSTSSITSPPTDVSYSKSPPAASSNFAVLANASVTCTDGKIIGDVGTFQATPTGSVTRTRCPINGKIHVGDGAATQAYNIFLTKYSSVAPKLTDPPCTMLTGTLAGVTLAPGVYCFAGEAAPTGLLTLNGPSTGVWTFKIGSGGTGALTGNSFTVVMAGGAQPCNVTWWVANGATMTDSNLKGTILGGAGITLTRGTFIGNALAKADATITGTAVTGCS